MLNLLIYKKKGNVLNYSHILKTVYYAKRSPVAFSHLGNSGGGDEVKELNQTIFKAAKQKSDLADKQSTEDY